MEIVFIIVFCLLMLLAYVFNISSSMTKIPSVILLLILGWGLQQAMKFSSVDLPDFSNLLPVLATIGLILIVLEGSLELKLNKHKLGLVRRSFLGALIPLILLTILFTWSLHYLGGYTLKSSLINAIPLCIISSAIAIPSSVNLSHLDREYVIYESSWSDILGVILFNFIALNTSFGFFTFGQFGLQLVVMVVVSLIATVGLSYMLSQIEHHVKFVPIILLVILIYAVAKYFHLPALIFVLIFGLALGNLSLLKKSSVLRPFITGDLSEETDKLKDLTIEGAFLIRALFFILFGFLLDTSEILNKQTFGWSVVIVICIFMSRFVQLKISKLKLKPLLFIAPRGLITILLFLAIVPAQKIPVVNKSLIIQVIIMTVLVMTFGLLATPNEGEEGLKER